MKLWVQTIPEMATPAAAPSTMDASKLHAVRSVKKNTCGNANAPYTKPKPPAAKGMHRNQKQKHLRPIECNLNKHRNTCGQRTSCSGNRLECVDVGVYLCSVFI